MDEIIYTEQNLVSITDSRYRDVELSEGQHWSFTKNRINIVDKDGVVRGFNKSSIRFASDGHTKTLSPTFN